MNSLLDSDREMRNREIRISTYSVVPMTKLLGILEWVDSTKVLKDILEKEY
jgi:DNA-dependent protein kinase catalytic subunit